MDGENGLMLLFLLLQVSPFDLVLPKTYQLNQEQNQILNKREPLERSKTNCIKLKIYSKSGHSARGRDVCCLADDHYKRKKEKNKIGDHDPFSTGTYLPKERQRIMDRYSNLS